MRPSKIPAKIRAGKIARVCSTGIPAICLPQMAALDRMAGGCRKQRKPWGFPVGTIKDANLVADMGAQFISFGSEFFGIHKHLETCRNLQRAVERTFRRNLIELKFP